MADVLAGGGQPKRAHVRRERGQDGEQRDGDDDGEQQAVADGDADTEVEVPRQKQREGEQGDRDSVAHDVGAGGHVADSRRPGNDGRGAGRHHAGVGRVVTLVAHVTIPLLSDESGVMPPQSAHSCCRAQAIGRRPDSLGREVALERRVRGRE